MQRSSEGCSVAQRVQRSSYGAAKLDFFYFGGSGEAAMGEGGAQRPVGRSNEPKKTGARSARARTRGQNPLVRNK